MDSILVNLMTFIKDGAELGCMFGMVMVNFLVCIWHLQILFPDQDIAMHANNVRSCFRQLKHHPDVMAPIHLSLYLSSFDGVNSLLGPTSALPNGNWFDSLKTNYPWHSLMAAHSRESPNTTGTNSNGRTACRIGSDRYSCQPPGTCIIAESSGPMVTLHHLFVDNNVYDDLYDEYHMQQTIDTIIKVIYFLLHKDFTKQLVLVSFKKLKKWLSAIPHTFWVTLSSLNVWSSRHYHNALLMPNRPTAPNWNHTGRPPSSRISNLSLGNWDILPPRQCGYVFFSRTYMCQS